MGDRVAGSVIQLNLIGGQALALAKQPVGVFGVAAAAHHHRQTPLLGQLGGDLLPGDVAAEHQNHLGRRWLGPQPAP